MSDTDLGPSLGEEQALEQEIEAMATTPEGEIVHLSDRDMKVLEAGRDGLVADQTSPQSRFENMAARALMYSQSDIAPSHIRGKPYNAFMILKTGEDLGLSDTGAMQGIDIIEGKPTISPEVLRGLVKESGSGVIIPHPHNDEFQAVAIPLSPAGGRMFFDDGLGGDPIPLESKFTWGDAQRMGLVQEDCTPDKHSDACVRLRKEGKRGRKCKDNWVRMPKRMLWARACGQCAHDYFPEVAQRIYSAEELGAIVDESGRPISLDEVSLPPGFELTSGSRGGGAQAEPADPMDLLLIELVVLSLTDEEREPFMEAWKKSIGWKAADLDGRGARKAVALVKGMIPDWKARMDVQGAAIHEWQTALEGAVATGTPVEVPEPTEEPAAPDVEDEPVVVDDVKARLQHNMDVAASAPSSLVTAVTASVKAMSVEEVTAGLAEAGLPAKGKADQLRANLTCEMLRARMEDPEHAKALQAALDLESKVKK